MTTRATRTFCARWRSSRCGGPWVRAERLRVLSAERKHDSKIVTVASGGQAATRVIVETQGVAIKENGPRETVARYGEVYAFAPATIVVHRDEPTQIEFWNLQADDDHDFILMDDHWSVLMKVLLPALKKTSVRVHVS